MRGICVCAVLTVLLAPAVPARAADRALMADAFKDLQLGGDLWDERAILSAVLARPAESAAFDAEARVALPDPKLRPLFIAAWRGKLVAYADAESRHPDIDLTRTYRNWTEIMTPEMRAYTEQRLLSMTPDNRDKLIYYLKKLNESLAANGGKIDDGMFSIAKRIVSGVMDAYRKDLTAYLASPVAQTGRAQAPGAAAALQAALAQRRAQAEAAAAPAPVEPARVPPPAPRAAKPPPPALPPSAIPGAANRPAGTVVSGAPAPGAPALGPAASANGALDQARAADAAGAAGGTVLDGGRGGTSSDALPVGGPPGATAAPSGLTAAGVPGPLAVGGPPAPGGESDLMSRIEGMSSGKKPTFGWLNMAGAGIGGIIGGLLGFLLGGPIGLAIGLAVGAGAGYVGTKVLVQKFT